MLKTCNTTLFFTCILLFLTKKCSVAHFEVKEITKNKYKIQFSDSNVRITNLVCYLATLHFIKTKKFYCQLIFVLFTYTILLAYIFFAPLFKFLSFFIFIFPYVGYRNESFVFPNKMCIFYTHIFEKHF